MLFPTHLVAGFLLTTRWRLSPYWGLAGAALPDVVDKPIAMTGVYGLYHSVGHSAVVFGLVTLLAVGVAATGRGRGVRRTGLAVWLGWGSHLLLDTVHMPLNGRPDDVRFLAWPLLEHAPAVRLPPVEFAVHYVGTPAFVAELLIWGAFAAAVVGRLRSREPDSTGRDTQRGE
ncbi:MAG: metal-dependent hydrolase [Haloarculaceae archaeon]